MIAFRFNHPISTIGTLTTTAGDATPAVSGNEVVVSLVDVPDASNVTLSLTDVNAVLNVSATLAFLIGDVDNSRTVNIADASAVKARAGQGVNVANFRFDINASGLVGAADISGVKARSGLSVP